MNNKKAVEDFWNEASCGEELFLKGPDEKQSFLNQSRIRYQLEPYILSFVGFEKYRQKKVLEIGVGLGADHQKFAEAGTELYGIDITPRAIENTRRRFVLFELKSRLATGDAESLDFENNSFDLVYSWGVIHHSPDTPKAIEEIFRVLKPGGDVKIMIYHTKSFVGYMLWLRYGLLKFRPFISLKKIYDQYLESPGTKAYSEKQARTIFNRFNNVNISIELSHGDLLSPHAGQRHQGALLNFARKVYPRWVIRNLFKRHGLFMLIHAKKPV